MRRTSFSKFRCPVAQALDKVGDWWSIILIRDAFEGLSRFDEFQQSLGISSNSLTSRLRYLVEVGVLERHLYQERPSRYQYVLTPLGREFFPVLITLFEWGNLQNKADDVTMLLGAVKGGAERRPVVMDKATGEIITEKNTRLLAGPAADAAILERVALVKSVRAGK